MNAPRPTLGVVVPCRNERAVIARKLRNLALLRWPETDGRPHRIVVVDDGSEDGTAGVAGALAGQLFPPHRAAPFGPVVEVVVNDRRPGKAGAVARGLAAVEFEADLVVLTDADVVLRPDALVEVADAFAADPGLGMACGSQEFVRALHEDGTPRGPDGERPAPAPGRYDLWTAKVRAWESRTGRLFSVHGQLLAWRTGLGIEPTPGVAADDLDLMCQVRRRALAVRKLDAARFLEEKTPAGPARAAQELRRARAYVQVAPRFSLPAGAPLVDRLHFAAYRWLPLAAPWLALAAGLFLLVQVLSWLPSPAGWTALAVLAGGAVSPPGRRLLRLLVVIARATLHEQAASLGDRWEMERVRGT